VPELEIPDVSVMEEREKLRLEKGEWEGAKERIRERRDVVGVASYAVESVTSLAKKDMEVPEWRRGSYGMAWGRAVHKMLEILARWDHDLDSGGEGDGNVVGAGESIGDRSGDSEGEDRGDTGADRYNRKLSLLAGNVLVTEEISMEKKGELVSLVESIMKSEFWERVNKAEKKLFEAPFSILTDKEAMEITEREEASARTSELTTNKKTDKQKLPIILTGAIDLAFLESGGWIIADFKTDDVRDNLESFVNYYAPQVKIYSRFWAEITKQPIKEAGLYFTSINKWVVVK
jgi:ATP-dependent helicase/nuclease subunit A